MMEVIKRIEQYETKYSKLSFEEVDGLLYSFLEEKYDDVVVFFTDPVYEIEINARSFVDIMNISPLQSLNVFLAKHGKNAKFLFELYETCRDHDEDYLYLRFN